MPTQNIIHDPRQYAQTQVKNIILAQTQQLVDAQEKDKNRYKEALESTLLQSLSNNNTLAISVALSMVSDQENYNTILRTLDDILWSQNSPFVVLPIVLVLGTKKSIKVENKLPIDQMAQCLIEQNIIDKESVEWLPNWLTVEQVASLKIEQWFEAGKNQQNAEAFLVKQEKLDLLVEEGQVVKLVFAIGIVKDKIKIKLNPSVIDYAMPLMGVLNDYFSKIEGLTTFANPLPISQGLKAITQAAFMRLSMALEVFSSNTIRSFRLKNQSIGVVCSSQTPNIINFCFSESDNEESYVSGFSWALSSTDDIDMIIRQFLDLMKDCQIQNILIYPEILPENSPYFNYVKATKLGSKRISF